MTIRLAFEDAVARITIANPDNGNLFTAAMMDELAAALREVDATGSTIAVLDGEGEDFTFGRDTREHIPGLSTEDNMSKFLVVNDLLASTSAVTIAAVRGHALGFGTGLALTPTSPSPPRTPCSASTRSHMASLRSSWWLTWPSSCRRRSPASWS